MLDAIGALGIADEGYWRREGMSRHIENAVSVLVSLLAFDEQLDRLRSVRRSRQV
jgi:hypothetical protein